MKTESKPYSPVEIDRLYYRLENQAKAGQPLFFEIRVDGQACVPVTCELQRFEELDRFISEDTRKITIIIYPFSHRRHKEFHRFHIGEASPTLGTVQQEITPEINRIEIEQSVLERMEKQRLQERIGELEKQLSEAEAYAMDLQARCEELTVKPNHIGKLDLGALLGSVLTNVAVNYPKVLEDVPVLNGVAQSIRKSDAEQKGQQQSPTGESSFRMKNQSNAEKESETQTMSEEDKEHHKAIQRLADFISAHFDQSEKSLLSLIIIALGEDTSKLTTVADLLDVEPPEE